jgi:hypothetical protein
MSNIKNPQKMICMKNPKMIDCSFSGDMKRNKKIQISAYEKQKKWFCNIVVLYDAEDLS